MSPEAEDFIRTYTQLQECKGCVDDLIKETPDNVLEEVFGV